MDYQIIETRGVSGVFPKPFDGSASAVVAVGWRGKLYTSTGQPLPDTDSLTEFCTRIGIRPETAKPRREHTTFLVDFRDTHFPRKDGDKPKGKKGKGGKPKAEAKPPRELTPEEKRHREVLNRMQAEFKSASGRGDRGKGRGDRIVLTMVDKHGKEAQAVHVGKGQFEPFTPREGGGTKTIARNRWAAKQFRDRYISIDGDVYAEELAAAQPAPAPEVPVVELTVELEPGNGTTNCPCDGHADGDKHPSGLFDTEARTFQCLATNRSWELVSEGGNTWKLVAA